ncbi:MAG: flagellar basal body P-ring formation chaperone FlgA [Rhizobiaceae bacterium]
MNRLARILVSVCAALAVAAPLAAETFEGQSPTVVVPNRMIYPGQAIPREALDVVPLRRQLDNPGAFVMTPEEAVGMVARSTLLPGRMMYTTAMRQPYLVETGAPARVMFVNGSLSISIVGVPLQSGAAGDLVRVRNMDSGIVFNGVVMADGTIRVGAT